MTMSKNTKIINIFGGPSAGKTGCAWLIAGELKKRGLSVEYVSEYAKELVWENALELLKDQEHIFENQNRRITRLLGKVDYIVTDSPTILSLIYGNLYGRKISPAFRQLVAKSYKDQDNYNFVIRRNPKNFEAEGRIQNLEESIKIDRQIVKMLREQEATFHFVDHESFIKIIFNELNVLE